MKKLFIFLMLGIFLLSMVSGAEFDNVLKYDRGSNGNPDLKVDLDNWFGLGKNLGTLELKSHNSVQEIKQVGAGNQVVMFYDVNSQYGLLNALGEPEFINQKNGRTVDREWRYVYWGNETYEEPIYSCLRKTSLNGTAYEECSQTGTETLTRQAWLPYNSRDIPKGNMRIGIEVEVRINDHIDGVWVVGGKKIDRHAEWIASLDDARIWYKLDEQASSGGTIIDATGNHNATMFGADNTTGKIVYAYDFESADATDQILIPSASDLNFSQFTVGFWMKPESLHSGYNVRMIGDTETTYIASINTGTIQFFLDSTTLTSNDVYNVGDFVFVIAKRLSNGTMQMKINDTLQTSQPTNTGYTGTGTIRIARDEGNTTGFDGVMDEIFIYNRSTTDAEDTILYNNFNGCTYGECDPVEDLEVTLLSPANDTGFTTTTNEFIWNVSDPNSLGITNTTIFIYNSTDLVYNFTNSSGFNGNYTHNITLSDGDYFWNATAFDGSDVNYSSETRSFSVDTTAPQIEINYPTNSTTIPYVLNLQNITLNVTVTDVHLDTCWYDYNSTNTTFSCSSGVLSENNLTVNNISEITVWANDSIGGVGSNSSDWTVTVFDFNNYTYTTQVPESTSSEFIGQFQLSSSIDTDESFLEYNNTNNSLTVSNPSGLLYFLSASPTSPIVGLDTNISWNFWVSGINATEFNQTVLNIAIDDCSVFTTLIYNFTIYNEEIPTTKLVNTTTDYAFNLYNAQRSGVLASTNKTELGNPFAVCLNTNLTTDTLSLDGTLKFFSNQSDTDFTIKYYNFLNESVSNSTIPENISLYTINSSESLPFVLTFRDSTLALAPNILILVDKQYLQDNDFKTVEIPKTDTNGQTILNLVRNTAVYNLIMIDISGTIVASFTNIVAFCQDFTIGSCSIDLNAPAENQLSYNYSSDIGISYSLGYSNNTKLISTTFNSIESENINIEMNVFVQNQFENRTVCDTSLNASSGTLTCNVSDRLDSNQFFFVTLSSNDNFIETAVINTNPNNPNVGTKFGLDGFFFALLLIIFIVLLFSDDKQILVLGLGVGWLVVTSLGLLKGALVGSGSAGIWLVITIIIFIWKLKSEEVG